MRNLEIFKAGKIFNSIDGLKKMPVLKYRHLKVTVPARLNAMCFDLKTLAKPNKKFVYNAGELAFSVNAGTCAEIKIEPSKEFSLEILKDTKRVAIVRHAVLIMKESLGINDKIVIEANNVYDYPHSGLGSSSSLITAVCVAINEAYGNPLTERQLTLFIAQNHGEEIDDDENNLIHVQCNGGSPSVALYKGGMQVIVGESNLLLREEIPDSYTFVFGIPEMYKKHDAKYLMSIETEQFGDMIKSRDDHSREIAWKVLHELVPAMMCQDFCMIGDVIKYYRFETGSLHIDSRTWNGLYKLMSELIVHKDVTTPVISVSSCGPAIYAITKDPEKIERIFSNRKMKIFSVTPNNTGYEVSYFSK